RQVVAGAQHITFGDPDFFNGIGHAIPLIEQFHHEFPHITYDVTIKIEHLKKYEPQVPLLKATGCLFVISAVESIDDTVLAALDKGHTREDFLQVSASLRAKDLTLHPTFVPFTPWTTLESYLDLLRVLYREDLVGNVAPIQLGIRLLIPEGSRMLQLDEIRRGVGPFDPQSLVYPWKNIDLRVDALSETIQQIASAADREKQTRTIAFQRIWQTAHQAAGIQPPELLPRGSSRPVPFLSEPWYCCAEPTADQLISIGMPKKSPIASVVSADNFV
ncbi:MAG: radical SAM protein, partial [Acidobacteriota bacterium]|nr:radical SAM protein [Acidobacteriota bacterium]